MSEVTHILSRIDAGDPNAAEHLLPLVYDELCKLATAKMASEKPGQTLQATALVHEAYIRVLGSKQQVSWKSRAYFYGAMAQAMRRILVDDARQKLAIKHGGKMERAPQLPDDVESPAGPELLLAINEALDDLAAADPQSAELVKLRYFGGFSIAEAAEIVGISRSAAYQHFAFAKAWLGRAACSRE
jgi:RNA polymerase sigma factor (TIGR02999 family)